MTQFEFDYQSTLIEKETNDAVMAIEERNKVIKGKTAQLNEYINRSVAEITMLNHEVYKNQLEIKKIQQQARARRLELMEQFTKESNN